MVDYDKLFNKVNKLSSFPNKPTKYRLSRLYYYAAYEIFSKAILYTPVDTGTLLNSIYIKDVVNGLEIGYTADYAVYVHEVDYNRHKPPTRSKFLEDAAWEVVSKYRSIYKINVPIRIEYSPLRVVVGGIEKKGELMDSEFKARREIKTIMFDSKHSAYSDIVLKLSEESKDLANFFGRFVGS